ncbi:MAG: DUF547 domain-containing protein [Hyphomicrobiaceae bacterium]
MFIRTIAGRAAPFAAAVVALTVMSAARAATVADTFSRHTVGSAKTVDHSAWDKLLKTYVVPSADGINRVDYAKFKQEAHAEVKKYVAALEAVDVATLDKPEQFAFWANLYNAKTIDVVLDKFPVKSIKDISLGGGLLTIVTGGPWKAKIMKVAGHELSLDDVEHAILRPIFKDPRAHYAVNCASIGCPNLPTEAFVGAKLEAQLDAGAKAYVNHPRGCAVTGGKVKASSIYNWFQVDFGGTDKGVLEHLRKYAEPALKQTLEGITQIAAYDYDWSLNQAKR